MNELTHCTPQNLQAYLDDRLDESLQVQLLAHLDQCESCRLQIESRAGSADDWLLAKQALADCEVDAKGNMINEPSLAESLGKTPSIDLVSLLHILSPSDDPRAAGRIGPFEITGIIGSGGMGLVLKARDPALDRFVAVKILAPHLAKSQSARKRFAREARAAAAVIHDNVIAIYQVAEWNELPYLVMPYMPDPSLQQRIDNQGRLDLESTLSIGMQVARGLAAAHTQGLVHRDVKPANVLLAKGTERAIITDFGLARAADDATLTRIGLLAGTPHYMSPEQARGESVDQKSDLFSLGSLLFAMITGQPPIANELGSETIQKIASGKVPSLSLQSPSSQSPSSQSISVPAWFVKLVDWLHRPNSGDRPESAAQVALLLEQCLAHQRQPDTQPIPECLVPVRKARRKRLVLAMVAIAFVVAMVSLPVLLPKKRPAESGTGSTTANSSLLIEPLQIDAPSSGDWFDEQVNFDELLDHTSELQSSINQVWGIMPEPGIQAVNEANTAIPFSQNPNSK